MAPLLAPGGRPVFQLAADGDLVGNHQAGVMANAVAIDKTGHAWVTSSSAYANNLSRLSPQGARVGVNSIEGSPRDIAVAPNGDLWILSDSRLTKLVP
jgi:streptogramin lyase